MCYGTNTTSRTPMTSNTHRGAACDGTMNHIITCFSGAPYLKKRSSDLSEVDIERLTHADISVLGSTN